MRWAAALLLALFVPAATAADTLLAANLSRRHLHGIGDWFFAMPAAQLPEPVRYSLRHSAKETFVDGVAAGGDKYLAEYRFDAPDVSMHSRLEVFPDQASAAAALEAAVRGAAAAARQGGAPLGELARLGEEAGARHFLVTRADRHTVGNLFLLQRGRNLYGVRIVGAGFLDDPVQVRGFLAAKAGEALDFVPDLPGGALRESELRWSRLATAIALVGFGLWLRRRAARRHAASSAG